MERGLYAAASGMIAQQSIQETLAQNIANANTVGYKHDTQTFRALQSMKLSRLMNGVGSGPEIGQLGVGCKADQISTDWTMGSLTQTKGTLDASLDPGQFFCVSTPRGERYTRAGDLQMDATGRLLTSSGQPILGANNQPIAAGNGTNFSLDPVGNLLSDGQTVAQLKIVQADPGQLRKEGNSLYAAINPAAVNPAARPVLHTGTLEMSNADTVHDLVSMITVNRGFEMAQRALTTQDEMLRRATNDLGKL